MCYNNSFNYLLNYYIYYVSRFLCCCCCLTKLMPKHQSKRVEDTGAIREITIFKIVAKKKWRVFKEIRHVALSWNVHLFQCFGTRIYGRKPKFLLQNH